MSLQAWGAVFVAFGLILFIYLYLKASALLDAEEESADLWREIDRAVPVWSRTRPYDWQEAGDL